MKFINLKQDELLVHFCTTEKKWGIYMSVSTDHGPKELTKAVPFLNPVELDELWFTGAAILLYDTEKELQDHFWQVVGDDGPTKTNPHRGPARVFALTCSPTGKHLNENT